MGLGPASPLLSVEPHISSYFPRMWCRATPSLADLPNRRQGSARDFHGTGMKRMGGHGHEEPFYVHAKHMYNLDRMKHQKLKVSLGVLACFSIGVGVPIYAVVFQQKKTASA